MDALAKSLASGEERLRLRAAGVIVQASAKTSPPSEDPPARMGDMEAKAEISRLRAQLVGSDADLTEEERELLHKISVKTMESE